MYKIVIADDEAIECRALEQMIAEGMDCCAVIKSVYNGMELLEAVEAEHPDIIIVDVNMPGLTGLDAIEILREKKKELKIIINTAYSEFSYIKRAMKYQVINYVLKPAKREELYGTLREVCAQLDEEKRIAEKNLRFEKMEGQHFMASLLLEEVDSGGFETFQEALAVHYAGGVCLCQKGGTAEKAEEQSRFFADTLRKKLGEDTLFLSRYHQEALYCLIVSPLASGPFQSRLTVLLQETADSLSRSETEGLQIGVSSWKETSEEFVQAIKECRRALQGRKTPGIYFFSQCVNPEFAQSEQIFAKIEECYNRQGWSAATALFLERISMEEQNKVPFAVFRAGGIVCLMRLLFEESRKSGGWYGTNLMRWDEWMALATWKDMEERLKESAELPYRKREEEKSRYVALAREYMEQNYAEDLSLDMVAEHAGITSFYMSRLFRKETGVNFTEILTDIRMEKTLELLWKNECSIREVSERTGYISINYFYKVFKKYFGITAGEFVNLLK